MNVNSKRKQVKQSQIKQAIHKNDVYSFFNVLTSDELLWKVEALLPEHRERLFPPTETLAMFIAQALSEDRSCQKIVNDMSVKRALHGLPVCSTSTGGYCKARQRLPREMVSSLACYVGQLAHQKVPVEWHWQNRAVKMIDGTTVSMPDTQANQQQYPQQGAQKPGLDFPLCRLLSVICLSSGVLLDAAVGRFNGKGATEQALLRELLSSFKPGDLVLGDSFYATYFLLAAMMDKGVDVVFEQQGARKRSTDYRKGQRLGTKDHLIEIAKPKIKPDWMTQEQYDNAPMSLSIRELQVDGKSLITTLLSPTVTPKHQLKILYRQRWNIELDLRNIKTTLGMETLSCQTPDMNIKEMWVYLLAYNLIRLIMAQSALEANVLPRQLSFKHALQVWLAWGRHKQTLSKGSETVLFMLIAQKKVGNRSGRIEPRAIKRRPKPFPLLMKPRPQAQLEVRTFGHP